MAFKIKRGVSGLQTAAAITGGLGSMVSAYQKMQQARTSQAQRAEEINQKRQLIQAQIAAHNRQYGNQDFDAVKVKNVITGIESGLFPEKIGNKLLQDTTSEAFKNADTIQKQQYLGNLIKKAGAQKQGQPSLGVPQLPKTTLSSIQYDSMKAPQQEQPTKTPSLNPFEQKVVTARLSGIEAGNRARASAGYAEDKQIRGFDFKRKENESNQDFRLRLQGIINEGRKEIANIKATTARVPRPRVPVRKTVKVDTIAVLQDLDKVVPVRKTALEMAQENPFGRFPGEESEANYIKRAKKSEVKVKSLILKKINALYPGLPSAARNTLVDNLWDIAIKGSLGQIEKLEDINLSVKE